jgi:hypothetical protein
MLGDVPPEHDLRGRMVVLMIYACGAIAWGTVVFDMPGTWEDRLVRLVVGAPLFGFAWFMARAVERFACWSWFFLSAWAVLLLPGAVGVLMYEDDAGTAAVVSAAAIMLSLGALHYLWVRRWDFWADTRFERLRPRRRVVTPEWRAARLAGIGTGAVRVRRTVSPRPGALWMRSASAVRR